jgi:WXG100 family type VII secretion target
MALAGEMGQAHGVLSAAAVLVDEARTDLDSLDRRLTEHLTATASCWGGQGSTAFLALGRAWGERQRVIVTALASLEQSLRTTERDNTATDETQSAAFAHAQQRLA